MNAFISIPNRDCYKTTHTPISKTLLGIEVIIALRRGCFIVSAMKTTIIRNAGGGHMAPPLQNS
jgi:hypothetical protein